MASVKALVDGIWYGHLGEDEPIRRRLSASRGFRNRIGTSSDGALPAIAERYHLYVSYACPWAHRTIIVRHLKALEHLIPMSVLHPDWNTPDGWRFAATPFSTIDGAGERDFLHEIYTASDPSFTGRVTVPCLFDTATGRIVNNESTDIMEMLNSAFDAFSDVQLDLYPRRSRREIEALNEWVLAAVCRAVYRVGFARCQSDYDREVDALFGVLARLEARLQRGGPYLMGDVLTAPDIHLFTMLCRFETYYEVLRCDLREPEEFPALLRFRDDVARYREIASTVKPDHIRMHYRHDLGEIEPSIVSAGARQRLERRVAE